jgi:hypothetical protein
LLVGDGSVGNRSVRNRSVGNWSVGNRLVAKKVASDPASFNWFVKDLYDPLSTMVTQGCGGGRVGGQAGSLAQCSPRVGYQLIGLGKSRSNM